MIQIRVVFSVIAFFGSMLIASAALSIDGYRYAIVLKPSDDSRGVQSRLSTEIEKSGLKIFSSADSLSPDDRLLTCRIEVSQYGGLTQYCHLSVRDLVSDKPICETTESCRARFGIAACITGSIEKAWRAVKYRGFDESAHRQNTEHLVESRPKINLEALKPADGEGDSILGEWLDPDSGDRLIVVPAPSGERSNFVAAIVSTKSTLWQKGEIKAEIQVASKGKTYSLDWYGPYKQRSGTVMTMDENGNILRFDIQKDDGISKHYTWLRKSADR